MKYACLLTESFSAQIAIVTLNRPQKRNALNTELLSELLDHLTQLQKLPDLRCIILKGSAPVFCAGLDLNEATQPEKRELSAQLLCRLFNAIDNLPFISIAAVQGAAIAGGAGLMLACDYVVAAENTTFAFPEVKRGLVAAFVATLLCRHLPMHAVKELLLFGEPFGGQRALALGLVNRITTEKMLLSEALHIAEKACSSCPTAVSATKHLLKQLETRPLSTDLEMALEFHRQARSSAAASEGVAAFLAKNQRSGEGC